MTAPKHQAAHEVDSVCCAIADALTKLLDAAYLISAADEINAVMKATTALHDKAALAHKEFEGHA